MNTKINPPSLYASYKSNPDDINEREFNTFEAVFKKDFDVNYTLQTHKNDISNIDDSFITPEVKQQKKDAEELAELKLKMHIMEHDLSNILGKLNDPNPNLNLNPRLSYYQEESKINQPANVYHSFSYNTNQNVS